LGSTAFIAKELIVADEEKMRWETLEIRSGNDRGDLPSET
jgi:hypothetical protein